MKSKKIGIVVMNLGSPDSPSTKDVRRYLKEFLMDERVIDMSYLKRWFLVNGIIAPLRAPNSAKAYQSIWEIEGSPLILYTHAFVDHLEQATNLAVEPAMRYGKPHPKTAFDNLLKRIPDLEEVILLPMYPHYAMSSYETAVEYAKLTMEMENYKFKLRIVQPFYKDPDYISALSKSIAPHLRTNTDLVIFSFHGIPERHVKKSDVTGCHCLQVNNCCNIESPAHNYCYRHQCMVTADLIAKTLKLPRKQFIVSFQSRLGKDPWLQPYTAQRLEQLPSEGIHNVVVVCPAFVADCLETLEEMAIEGKEIFLASGGNSFNLVPCLNKNAEWVHAVNNWIADFRTNKEQSLIL